MIERILIFMLLPQDKANHAFYSLFMYIILCELMSSLYSLVSVILMAIAKEWLDKRDPEKHTADIKDFYYSVAPSGIAYALGIIKETLWL